MLNFLDLCSLDIHYDLESNALLCGESIKYNQFQKVRLKNLSPILLNKALTYPEDVYEEYIGVFEECDKEQACNNLSYDLINLPAGLLGIEYVKTHIFFTTKGSAINKVSSFVEVLHGDLKILLQKNAPADPCEFGNRVDEAFLVQLQKGDRFSIPEGFYYTFINTGDSSAIFSRAYKNYCIADYTQLRRDRGLAYYCIRKNGRQEIVYNPLYRDSPSLHEVDASYQLTDPILNKKSSLYEQIKGQIDILMSEINS